MDFTYRGIFGADIAFYQGNPRYGTYVDFTTMKGSGASFVIIKAGQLNYADSAFSYNWKAAKAAGLPRGAYWFLDWRAEGKAQAEFFWNLVKDDLPEGPLVLDYESGSGGDWHKVYDFMVRLQELSQFPNHKLWIYSGYFYWTDFGPKEKAQLDWFKQFPLWQPWYIADPVYVDVPYPWSTMSDQPVLWQKGTTVVPGPSMGVHSQEIDFNLFNGGWEVFTRYFSTTTTPPPVPEPPQGATMQYKVVWAAGVARRTAPTTSNSYTGLSYPFGQVLEVVEENIPDATDPTNPNKKWVKFADGLFGASLYPNSAGVPQVRMEKVEQEPVPVERKIVKGVLYFDDGTSVELFPQ